MTRIIDRIKAIGPGPAPNPAPNPAAPANQPPNAELLNEVNDTITEIGEFEAQNGWALTDSQLTDLRRILLTLKAEQVALSAFGVSGATPGGNGAPGNTDPFANIPTELQDYWNGIPPDAVSQDDLRGLVEGDADYFGEYMGTVNAPYNSAQAGLIAFQAPENVREIYGETIGNHMAVTIGFLEGGVMRYQTWIVRDATTRPDALVFSARGLPQGVAMDFSRVVRINDGSYPASSYDNQKLYLIGTDHNDTIVGAMGARNSILGGAGNDTITGGAYVDDLYGDEYYPRPGFYNEAFGGRDRITGGAGRDHIYAGGDNDTVSQSDRGEDVFDSERVQNDVPSALPPWAEFITNSDGGDWAAVEDAGEAGTIVLENSGDAAGTIEINMASIPGDYTMVIGNRSAEDLLLTFVGDDGTFKVRVKDFFNQGRGDTPSEQLMRLRIIGSDANEVMDMRNVVNLTGQVINLEGRAGDDIVMNANYQFITQGGDITHMLESHGNNDGQLQDRIEEGHGILAYDPTEAERSSGDERDLGNLHGYRAQAEDNQIHITRGTGEQDDYLRLGMPEGYDAAYITEDNAGNLYVIFVDERTDGSTANTIVVKIDAVLGLDADHIQISRWVEGGTTGSTTTTGHWGSADVRPTVISNGEENPDDYLTDGGAGNDLIIGQRRSRIRRDAGDSVVETSGEAEGAPPPAPPVPPAPGSGTT